MAAEKTAKVKISAHIFYRTFALFLNGNTVIDC